MAIERVLVTGAGGFIGSHLVDEQLSKSRKVTALDINLDRLEHQRDNQRCQLQIGDIRDNKLLQRVVPNHDVIFHLASAHLEVNQGADYFEEINVAAVRSLVEIAEQSGVDRLVHCSSVGVFGPLKHIPADEGTECHPEIPYEKTKLAGERVVQGAGSKLAWVILRPAWVYGPRCSRTLKLFQAINNRKFVKVGYGRVYRHPLYIEDMTNAFEQAATSVEAVGQTMIVGADEPVLLDELISGVVRSLGIDYRPRTVPLMIMAPVCFAVEKAFGLIRKEPPFSSRSLKFFTESSGFDISRARRVLGFNPKVGIQDGLALTARYFKKQGLL